MKLIPRYGIVGEVSQSSDDPASNEVIVMACCSVDEPAVVLADHQGIVWAAPEQANERGER